MPTADEVRTVFAELTNDLLTVWEGTKLKAVLLADADRLLRAIGPDLKWVPVQATVRKSKLAGRLIAAFVRSDNQTLTLRQLTDLLNVKTEQVSSALSKFGCFERVRRGQWRLTKAAFEQAKSSA